MKRWILAACLVFGGLMPVLRAEEPLVPPPTPAPLEQPEVPAGAEPLPAPTQGPAEVPAGDLPESGEPQPAPQQEAEPEGEPADAVKPADAPQQEQPTPEAPAKEGPEPAPPAEAAQGVDAEAVEAAKAAGEQAAIEAALAKKQGDAEAEAEGQPKAETQPAAAVPTTEEKFPTPAELIARIKKQSAEQAALSKIAHFDLATAMAEKPADFSLFGDPRLTLRTLVERMRVARDDKNVRGVLLTLGEPGLNLAQAQEVRDALIDLRRAGKKTFVYADGYDTATYTIASGATDVCLLEGGELMIPGVGMEATFAKGLLDKIGVKADYVQIGEYKGADEQFTREGPSEELKGELTRLTEALYEQIVDGISVNRNLSKDAVRQMIDETMLPAQAAKDRGFVDHLVDMDDLRGLMGEEMGNALNIVTDFGQPARQPMDFSSPLALLQMLNKPAAEAPSKPTVAIIYAEGTIVDGEGGDGLFSDVGVASANMRRAFRRAANDPNVKAVVIRIDSPGGSALASEVMWQAARHVAAKKPVIVSIGSMAASGGYYLASAGDHIFADPSAIVGSIGVVGGKFVMKDLFDKLGVNTASFSKGRNAGLFSSNAPFDERQRRMVTNWMKGTYDQFTKRIMTTRGGKIKDIDQVARGRIFLAKQAKELGMVDELGGLEAALEFAANKAQLAKGTYEVQQLPAPKTLLDMFGAGAAQAGDPEAGFPLRPRLELGLGENSLLNAVDPITRKALGQHLQMLQLLQDRPVVLVAPFVVTIR